MKFFVSKLLSPTNELFLPEVSSGFLFCLPAICSHFSETLCFHVRACVKGDLGNFLGLAKESSSQQCPQPSLLQAGLHNLLCLPVFCLKLELNLQSFSVSTTYTKAKGGSSIFVFRICLCFLSTDWHAIAAFCFLLVFSLIIHTDVRERECTGRELVSWRIFSV